MSNFKRYLREAIGDAFGLPAGGKGGKRPPRTNISAGRVPDADIDFDPNGCLVGPDGAQFVDDDCMRDNGWCRAGGPHGAEYYACNANTHCGWFWDPNGTTDNPVPHFRQINC